MHENFESYTVKSVVRRALPRVLGVLLLSGAAHAQFSDFVLVTDLRVTQSVAPTGSTGKDVVFTITVANLGPNPASLVGLIDQVPAGTDFIWASPGCVNNAGSLNCDVGTIASGASTAVKLVVRPTGTGSITNTATAGSVTIFDTNPANDASSTSVTVSASTPGTAVQRYRLYSPVTQEHHFTTDLNEYNVLGTLAGTWVQEGTVGKVLNNPGVFNAVAAVPYYRLYNSTTRWHHWTTDANEYYTLVLYPGWNGEGVDGYILPSQPAGAIPLYRLVYPPVGGLHHWTIDANEYNALISTYGWVGEGGSGYVIQ